MPDRLPIDAGRLHRDVGWRSVKYEEVYLHAYDSVSETRASLGRYFDFYNQRRPHASLAGCTPDQACFNPLPFRMAA